MISTAEHPKKYIDVNGKRMAYVEMGEGDPIVFQHGNPTSSYLWRNIMPPLASRGRCIAVDLIGMGDSDKLDDPGPESYRYLEHREYLFKAWEMLGVDRDVTLVIHDWGSALGFDWASQHPERVRGICYMEGIPCPISWDELTWPRQIPLDGEPADVAAIAERYAAWLGESPIPKLFINADPGAILVGRQREFARSLPNQTEVTVRGSHFIQEDSPVEIATAISDWLATLSVPPPP